MFIYCKNNFTNTKFNFLALSYETDPNDVHADNLKRMFIKNKYPYKILGNNETWRNWSGRAESYKKYLKTLDPDIYILLCDARDVLINRSHDDFIEIALKLRNDNNNKIIIGTEDGCCVGANDNTYKAKNITDDQGKDYLRIYMNQQENNSKSKGINNKFYYINFGLIFATAAQLVDLFEKLNVVENNDDQGLTHKLFYENPDLLFLDHAHVLFSNAGHRPGENAHVPKLGTNMELCYFKWDDTKKQFYNTLTNTYPIIIQTPGKNWDCYKYIAKKLIDNPKFY